MGDGHLQAGQLFAGRYEIARLLGAGERKQTYLARDVKLDRHVAVATVRPQAALVDPDGTEREAKVLGHIGAHDNIVALYDFEVDTSTGLEYMVFEYLAGGTLAEHLEDVGRPPLEDILRFARQLCRGLAHLHAQGILHRDVSPGNVWLDDRSNAHLGDFDSAIVLGDDVGRRPLTTNAFASPEERSGHALDLRADLFSLGGVLGAIAVGSRRPVDADEIRSERADLPSSFADLVERLLSPSPDDRPDSTDAVLASLDAIRRSANVDALIAREEGQHLEFKASLIHPYRPDPKLSDKENKRVVTQAVTKTIAAFLNSSGGDLVIGIHDKGEVLGIEPDFAHLHDKPNADGWLMKLKDAISDALGLDVWNAIHVSLVPCHHHTVAVVSCPPRSKETWCTHGNKTTFFARTGNATEPYEGRELVEYIRERWATV